MPTRLITLDSRGVTWLMIEVRIGLRRRVIAVTSMKALYSCRLTWPCDFAERRFRLEPLGVDEALDHDLGFGRHQQVDGLRAHHVDRPARQRARDSQLVERLRQLLHRRVGDDRRAPSTTAQGSFLPRARIFPSAL